MAGDQVVAWRTCSHDGCVGVRLAAAPRCLAHAAERDPPAFEAELERIGAERTIDARGVQLSAELVRRILDAAAHQDDRPVLRAAQFDGATFQGDTEFTWVIFQQDAAFEGATFRGRAGFAAATFKGHAGFKQARFEGDAEFGQATFEGGTQFEETAFRGWAVFERATFEQGAVFQAPSFHEGASFHEATFQGEVWFSEATFHSEANFAGATFRGGARFDEATFQGETWFNAVTFEGETWFAGTTFQREVGFHRTTFQHGAGFDAVTFQGEAQFFSADLQGDAQFDQATFEDNLRFDDATFQRARQIGPLLAKELILDDATFHERVQLDVAAGALCARRTQFRDGVQLRLRWASVVLEDANLAAPAILAGVPPFPGLDEQAAANRWERLPPGPRAQRWRPRLLSLCRADVAGLRIAEVDLRPCRFVGAHNLDKLRIEGTPLFARTGGWWRARRKTLAEEQQWRASRPGRWRHHGWYPRACQLPAAVEPPAVLVPAQLAALYRELRKGREDAKDEPGAADFYYGEMEMRRRNHATPWAERLVLWLYWLVSGYALRAWRALAAFTTVVLLAAVAFAFWGFPPSEPGFRAVRVDAHGALVYEQRPADRPSGVRRVPAAIRFSAQSATALLRGPDRTLTPLGEWLEIALRFLGPVLLGLAVLSVRGRVRR